MFGTTSCFIEIDTVPSSLGNILPTGYSARTLTAVIERYPYRCYWEYGASFETNIHFFNAGCHISCRSQHSNHQVQITCLKEESIVTSTSTFTQPLNKGVLNIRVNYNGSQKALPTITFQGI